MREVNIGGLIFRNPVITASGTFGMGDVFEDFIDYAEIGGITLKTVTTNPRPGNLPPRILETPSGLLNSIGLENEGFTKTYQDLKNNDTLKKYDTNVIFSISGETPADFIKMAAAFNQIDGIDMIELNLSCPNIHAGGSTFDADPDSVRSIVSGVREAVEKPFTTKLSPNQDILRNAVVAESAGSPAITVSNTFLGMAIDIKTGKPVFQNTVAGFSGPAVKPMALLNVYKVAKEINIPIIASGGISSANDAIEFIHAGAALVSIGTMNFVEPDIAVTIARGLDDFFMDKD